MLSLISTVSTSQRSITRTHGHMGTVLTNMTAAPRQHAARQHIFLYASSASTETRFRVCYVCVHACLPQRSFIELEITDY